MLCCHCCTTLTCGRLKDCLTILIRVLCMRLARLWSVQNNTWSTSKSHLHLVVFLVFFVPFFLKTFSSIPPAAAVSARHFVCARARLHVHCTFDSYLSIADLAMQAQCVCQPSNQLFLLLCAPKRKSEFWCIALLKLSVNQVGSKQLDLGVSRSCPCPLLARVHTHANNWHVDTLSFI